jgi:hypothetical protein
VECASESFERFVGTVTERHPGWCSSMFEDYVGPPGREIEFIGRFERLVDDFVVGLRSFSVAYDEALLRATPPSNVSPSDYGARWTASLAAAVANSEREALTRFGYDGPPWR